MTITQRIFAPIAFLLISLTSLPAIASQALPPFDLPSIYGSSKDMTDDQLKGQVSLLNIWASWCSACASEHRLLLRISNDYHVRIYGILYKDNTSDALSYLNRVGNPYYQIGSDPDGEGTSNFNVYGTPETYIIAPDGSVVYHQTGAMTQSLWDNVLYPIVKRYQQ